MSSAEYEQEIEIKIVGSLAIITLNRPAALNALTLNMLTTISDLLDDLLDNHEIKVILFTGKGDRAFCAGGDIKHVAEKGVSDPVKTAKYFYHEYNLNRKIYDYPKPVISYMNGIVMGGGFGIAGPSRFRIASERTLFAMPEVGIGLFPDVGSMYYLTKLDNKIGCYLSITGNHFKVADVLKYNIADSYISNPNFSKFLENLIQFLSLVDPKNDLELELIKFIKDENEEINEVSELSGKEEIIDRVFKEDKVEMIIENLNKEPDPWAQDLRTLILERCPLSLKVSLKHYKRSIGRSFHEITEDDFMIVQHILKGTEFYEGVRALLIDKDKNPKWNPASIYELNEEAVNNFFTPTEWKLDDIIVGNN